MTCQCTCHIYLGQECCAICRRNMAHMTDANKPKVDPNAPTPPPLKADADCHCLCHTGQVSDAWCSTCRSEHVDTSAEAEAKEAARIHALPSYDEEYKFGRQLTVAWRYPFTERQFARLMLLRGARKSSAEATD